MAKINNFYNGEIYRSLTVNAFNPNIKKIYNQILLIQEENKQYFNNQQAGIEIEIVPNSYEKLISEGEKMIYEQQAPLIDLQINVKINTSKMPTEVLAKLIKTNTQNEVDRGESTGKYSRCLVEMYTTRKEYQQKIKLKSQSKINFAKFKCEAKSCGRTNSHRTTLYAVIDKASHQIKYYGSSCINKVDGVGTVENLQHLVDTVNKFIEGLDKSKNKFLDGIKVLDILKTAVDSYTKNKNSKFYYQNIFYGTKEVLEITKHNGEIKDKFKNGLSPIFLKHLDNPLEIKVIEFTFVSLIKHFAKLEVDRINLDNFIKYLNRSRAIGSVRSNAKTLIQALKAEGKARAISATSMRKLFLINLKNYHLEMVLNDIKNMSDNELNNLVYQKMSNAGINLVDFNLEKENIDFVVNIIQSILQKTFDEYKQSLTIAKIHQKLQKQLNVRKLYLYLKSPEKIEDNNFRYTMELSTKYYEKDNFVNKIHLNEENINLSKSDLQNKYFELSIKDYSIDNIFIDFKKVDDKIKEYHESFKNIYSILYLNFETAKKTQNRTDVNKLINSIVNTFENLPIENDSISLKIEDLKDKNKIKQISNNYLEKVNQGKFKLFNNIFEIIKEVEINISKAFLNKTLPIFNENINNKDLQNDYQKILKTVTRKKKGIPDIWGIFAPRIKTNIEKKRVFNSYLGYFDNFEQLQLIDKDTNNIVGTMKADDISEFKEYQDNIQKTIINSLIKTFKQEFTFEEYIKYKDLTPEKMINQFLENLSNKKQYLGNLRLNRR